MDQPILIHLYQRRKEDKLNITTIILYKFKAWHITYFNKVEVVVWVNLVTF